MNGTAQSNSNAPSKNPISVPSNGHSIISKLNELEKHSETHKNDDLNHNTFSLDSAHKASDSTKETTIKSGTRYQNVFVDFR